MSAAPFGIPAEPSDCRCVCGNLIARVVADGVELKCRRCKRTLLVAVPVGGLEPGSLLRVRGTSDSG
jgi:hypothetical protein